MTERVLLYVVANLAALLIVAEAFNKLERTDLFDGAQGLRARARGVLWLLRPWRWTRPKLVIGLKLLAWACLAIGAAGALATTWMPAAQQITGREAAVLAGFAILIVRSRLKEG